MVCPRCEMFWELKPPKCCPDTCRSPAHFVLFFFLSCVCFLFLERVGFEDLAVSLCRTPAAAITTTGSRSSSKSSKHSGGGGGGGGSKSKNSTATTSSAMNTAELRQQEKQQQQQHDSGERERPKSHMKVLADLAMVARLRLRLSVVPGTMRALAKEAMLAEGRAFERYDAHSTQRVLVVSRTTAVCTRHTAKHPRGSYITVVYRFLSLWKWSRQKINILTSTLSSVCKKARPHKRIFRRMQVTLRAARPTTERRLTLGATNRCLSGSGETPLFCSVPAS